MFRRVLILFTFGLLLLAGAGCSRHKNVNPIADVDSKQPDKVLYDRAMDALRKGKYDVTRVTLQTLINTYPDSEFIARAKLSIGDAWFLEGTTAALTQAENEYKDFQTFFPNMPESAEAQMKIANIHFNQMEKPDRDFTHAKRAEDEFRQMILQYPDSKLIPEAKMKLLKVQEVLAEREFRIGRFYYLRESHPAAIARLKTLTDTYPLYSQADESLFLLGQEYETQAEAVRLSLVREPARSKLLNEYRQSAIDAYSKIVTRYPLMPRVEDAKRRLAYLEVPVPAATPEAIAQNKAELESRGKATRMQQLTAFIRKHPDVPQAAKVGEPTLVDPRPASAADMIKAATETLKNSSGAEPGSTGVSIQTTDTGNPPAENQPAPRSDAGSNDSAFAASGNVPEPPARVNDAATGQDPQNSVNKDSTQSNQDTSSSKKKKKRKLLIF